MDRATVEVYEHHAAGYASRRGVEEPERARAFAASMPEGGVRLDLGCGPGHHLPLLGEPAVALDAAVAMLDLVPDHAPTAWRVQADQEALPFRSGSLVGVWANKCLQHVGPRRLPAALAGVHRAMAVGGRLAITVFRGDGELTSADDLPGRYFALWQPTDLVDVLVGAGFAVDDLSLRASASTSDRPARAPGGGAATSTGFDGRARRSAPPPGPGHDGRIDARIEVDATRARSLADTVGPDMALLICGLNPSLYAADAGVAFARPGNRFWPALRAAGLTSVDRDPAQLLAGHGIGMTDIVKRATVAADELAAEEYAAGLARVERLCRRLAPAAVCLVGLAGWRSAVDRRAVAGWQPDDLGGSPVYLMPSTSGLNAHVRVDDLARHLAIAAAGPAGAGDR